MTDESRPLSRRERREQELRAAARPADDTDAFPGAPISDSIPTHSPDGRPLTRRERRRLERARRPMETWTAEEEMIATGQIPAMTPERIAEQERIAREKAEAAQRDAQTASSELGIVTSEAADSAPSEDEPAAPSARAASVSADSPPEPTVPQRTSLIPPSTDSAAPDEDYTPDSGADAPQAAHTPQPELTGHPDLTAQAEGAAHVDDVAEVVEHPQADATAEAPGGPDTADVEPAEDEAAAVFGEQPQADHQWWDGSTLPDDREQPDRVIESDDLHADAPAPDERVTQALPPTSDAEHSAKSAESATSDLPPAVAGVPGMPPGMSPEMFAALFPPGSLQRRLMEQQAADQAQQEAPEPAVEDPAEEIRRLTQQAVAGIDAASSRRQVVPTEVNDPAAESAARAVLPNAWGPAAENVGAPATGSGAWSASPPMGAFPEEATGPQPWSASAPESTETNEQPRAGEQPFELAPQIDETGHDDGGWDTTPVSLDERPASLDEAPFDAILGDHPATQALDEVSNASVESHRPAFHTVSTPSPQGPAARVPDASDHLTPHYAAFDVPTQAGGDSEQATSLWDAHPLMDVNRVAPELPEVRPAQNIPQPDLSSVRRPSFTPQVGDYSSIEPVPTGQIEVPPRERPDLDVAGGPRHFRWAHLAVFGAVAFLLGVVVWNVAMKP